MESTVTVVQSPPRSGDLAERLGIKPLPDDVLCEALTHASFPNESSTQATPPPLAEWRWRTMPVFIALSAGLFVGLYLGIIIPGTGIVATVVFLAVAGMLGISVSRYVMRLLMQRGIIKPQAKRR